MRFTVGSTSDVGQVRSLNEDSLFTGTDLFAVADGMGGHRGGEVASARALDALRDAFAEHDGLDDLVDAVQRANRTVFEMAQADPELAGMGTTLCALGAITTEAGPRLGVVNVGDSRVYLFSDGHLTQLSEDHSFVEALVRDGRLTRAQADVHPQRNVLTRALGIEPDVQIDAWIVTPRDGDRFLLCSDGLFNEVSIDDMTAVLAQTADPGAATTELVRRANESGGRDNITCVIVDVELDGDSAAIVAAEPAAESGEVTPSDRVVRRFDPTDDLAAFDDEQISAAESVAPAESPAPDTTPARPPRAPRSSRWRSFMFVGAVVATLAVAFGAVAWAARGTYYVGYQSGEVVIFQGRPGGLLWFDPTVDEHTGIKQGELSASEHAKIVAGVEKPDRAAALLYVSNLRSQLVTTTTAPPETSTTTSAVTTETSAPGATSAPAATTIPPG